MRLPAGPRVRIGMTHLVLAALSLGLAACATSKPSAPPPGKVAVVDPVDRVELRGNQVFTTPVLRGMLRAIDCDDVAHRVHAISATAPLGEETPACGSLEDFALTLEDHYHKAGYLAADVRADRSRRDRPALVISEGRRFVIGALEVGEVDRAEDDLGTPDTLRVLLGVYPGDPLDLDAIRTGLAAIRARYEAAGYEAVNIVPITDIDMATATVDLSLAIERGRRR